MILETITGSISKINHEIERLGIKKEDIISITCKNENCFILIFISTE